MDRPASVEGAGSDGLGRWSARGGAVGADAASWRQDNRALGLVTRVAEMTDPKTGRKSKLHLLMMKAAMSALRTVALIARREFITRARTRVFITSTVLVLLGIAGYVALQVNVLNKQTAPKATTVNVAFVGDVSGLANGFTAAAKAANFTITTKTVADEAEGRTQIQQGKLDAVISGPIDKPHLLVSDNFDPQLQGYFQNLVYQHVLDAQLAAAGLNPADIEAKLNAASITVDSVTQAANQRTEKAWSGLIAAILLFLVFQAYGNLIAAGVVEEKANRVVEILLATVRPTQLLVGKVAGIGLVGLFQLTVSGAFAIAAVTVSHLVTVPSIAIGVVLAGILWFLLGFALYGVLYAAAGSLVSRAEEAQGTVLPVTLFIVEPWQMAGIDSIHLADPHARRDDDRRYRDLGVGSGDHPDGIDCRPGDSGGGENLFELGSPNRCASQAERRAGPGTPVGIDLRGEASWLKA
jgi:ABC-2 type transport system permease protein